MLAVQNGRVMVGGQHTSADAILKLTAQRMWLMIDRLRPLPMSDRPLAPDVIVAMRRSSDKDGHDLSRAHRTEGRADELQPARAKLIIVVEGLYTLGFRPSGAATARELDRQGLPACDRPGSEDKAGSVQK